MMKLEQRELEFTKKFFGDGQIRVFVDATFNENIKIGSIAFAVYSNDTLFTKHKIETVPSRSSNALELLGVEIAYKLYKHSKIHTDSEFAYSRVQNVKIKCRLYLINGKHNPADSLLRYDYAPEKIDLEELAVNWSRTI